MDWPNIALDWVNSLRLTENPLQAIKELGDGKFLCEVLQILFHKTVDVKNKAQIFHILKISLKDSYTPPDWINFEDAYDSNVDELLKIITVLIGVSSLQSEEKLFLENPSTYLNTDTQVVLTKFLEYVLDNGKVVDSRFIANLEEKENNSSRSNRRTRNAAPKVLFPTNTTVAESPHIYVLSPSKDWNSPQKSPLRDFLSSPVLESDRLLMSEKNNEISNLRNRIEVLTACQRDLMDDINSYREESSKLSQRCDELEKENHSLRVKSNLNKTFTIGSPSSSETPEKTKKFANNLKDKLKVSENYVDVLESKIDEGNNKILKLEEDIATLKENLQQASLREVEMLKELENDEIEKNNLRSQIDNTNEIIKKLSQEIEDCKDSQQMNGSDNHYGANGLMGLSICDSFDTSVCSKSLGLSTCEDMASAVIEVQLRETQTTLKDTETTLGQTMKKLEVMESKAKKREACMQELEIKLQEKTDLLQTTSDTLGNVELKLEEASKSLLVKNQILLSTEMKIEEMSNLLDEKAASLKSAEVKIDEISNLLDEKTSSLKTAEVKIDEIFNLLEEKATKLERAEVKIDEISNLLDEKTSSLKSAKVKINEISNLLEQKTTSLKSAEVKIDEISNLLDEKTSSLKTAGIKIEEMSNLLEEKATKLERADVKLVELTKLLGDMDENIIKTRNEVKSSYSKKFEDLKKHMTDLTSRELEKMELKLAEKQREIELLRENAIQSENNVEMIETLKRERALLRSANLELTNKIYNLEQRIRQLKNELDAERSEMNILKAKLQSNKARNHSQMDSHHGYVNPSFESERDRDSSFTSLPPINFKSEFPSIPHQPSSADRRLSSVSMMSVRSNGSTNSARAKAVPDGAGKYFSCADEEDMEFVMMDKKPFDFHIRDNTFSSISSHRSSDVNSIYGNEDGLDRMREIQRRNTMMPMHMRSCYPNEEFRDASPVDENILRALPGLRPNGRGKGSQNMPKSVSGPSVVTNKGFDAFTIPLDPPKKSVSGTVLGGRIARAGLDSRTPLSPNSSYVNRNASQISTTTPSSSDDPFRQPGPSFDERMNRKQKSDSALTMTPKKRFGLKFFR